MSRCTMKRSWQGLGVVILLRGTYVCRPCLALARTRIVATTSHVGKVGLIGGCSSTWIGRAREVRIRLSIHSSSAGTHERKGLLPLQHRCTISDLLRTRTRKHWLVDNPKASQFSTGARSCRFLAVLGGDSRGCRCFLRDGTRQKMATSDR